MGKTPRQVGEDMNHSLKTARVYQVNDIMAARKKRNSWWYLVQFGGYEEPEWVQDRHLEDAGTWGRDKMIAARMAGTTESTTTETNQPRRSPRLAQAMNRMEHELLAPMPRRIGLTTRHTTKYWGCNFRLNGIETRHRT